ncbi:MAG TPA: hypothetical protein VIG89_03230, partial [Candidatus Acidoferrales bacterium]
MRRQAEPTDDDILNLLRSLHRTASLREMAEALGTHHAGRRALPKILLRLKKQGLVEEVRRDRFRLAERKPDARPDGRAPGKEGLPPQEA